MNHYHKIKYFSHYLQILLFLVLLFTLIDVSQSQSLSRILKENDEITILSEFKDDESTLRIKLKNLEKINQDRANYRLKPVELDILASRVANQHCKDMIDNNYGGHWDSKGRKPYQRYALANGIDHIAENLYILQQYRVVGGKKNLIAPEMNRIPEFLQQGEESFMAEKPPNDGHRKEILNYAHTHVGLGYALGKNGFRYCQLFIDRYLEIDNFPRVIRNGTRLEIKGQTIDSNFGLYGGVVYYDPYPKPLSSLTQQPNKYPDFGKDLFKKIPPWETPYNERTRRFSFPISFENARKGLYYLILYVKSPPSNIPYNPRENVEWNTSEGIPATSIIIEVR